MRLGQYKPAVCFLCLLFVFSTAFGAQKNKDKKPPAGKKGPAVSTTVAVDIFATRDRDLIRNHFRNNLQGLPPGLAKRDGDLPPGLEKQLRRNGHLPPGLEKRLNPFPVELERRLPPLKEGLIRGIIGGSAVIMNRKTSLILDVFVIQ